jgi:hypothetical protein
MNNKKSRASSTPASSTPVDPLHAELQALERDLAALTIRVRVLRARVDYQGPPVIGDRVRFLLAGFPTDGVIIGITTHRIQIRQDRTNHVLLRAPHNVTVIDREHGGRSY